MNEYLLDDMAATSRGGRHITQALRPARAAMMRQAMTESFFPVWQREIKDAERAGMAHYDFWRLMRSRALKNVTDGR